MLVVDLYKVLADGIADVKTQVQALLRAEATTVLHTAGTETVEVARAASALAET